MDKKEIKIGAGLKKLPIDKRDFSLNKKFGGFKIYAPDFDFTVADPLEIKNQGPSDFCTAFSACAVSEDQEGVLLSPEWFFSQVKNGDKSWGADLRAVCKTAVKKGFLEQSDAPYTLKTTPRDLIVDYRTWPDFGDKPLQHKKKSYFSVDLYEDLFDSFRTTLYQHRFKRCSILTGCIWEDEWTNAEGGIIPEKPGTPGFGHAFKIYGQKNINGKLYLVAQLSNGTEIGDKGIFYFSREVTNRVFKGYGAFCFIDDDPEEYKKKNWTFYQKFMNTIKQLLPWQK